VPGTRNPGLEDTMPLALVMVVGGRTGREFSVQCSAFGVRRSAFGVRRSVFGVWRLAFDVQSDGAMLGVLNGVDGGGGLVMLGCDGWEGC